MGHTTLRTFGRGGIHPDPHKEATAALPIEELAAVREVRLPLLQHLGDPAVPIVKKGEMVRRGQKIAEGGETGVPLHATISGKVKPIDKQPHPTLVLSPAITIARADDAGPEIEYAEDPAWRSLDRAEAFSRVREAGIVGLGGAAFPTWRKLQFAAEAEVDTVVVNGAECEPYLTSDYRLMLGESLGVVEGSVAIARMVGAARALIGIESDKPDAARAIAEAVALTPSPGVAMHVVPVLARYPQGAEKQLVQAVTGRVVPPRQLPLAIGVLVQNVATALAVRHALRWRKPLLDRVMTVTGPGVRRPANVRVPLGTLLSELVEHCGGITEDATRLIAGGPMMGRALPRLDVPVLKGMNGLVVLTGPSAFDHGFLPCISCGRCVEACPLGLEPDQVSVRVEAGRSLDAEPYGALECYECGCCTYVCPSHRPLVQFMQVAKGALRRAREVRAKA
jgi:electron transport complex protein RnfC